MGEHAYLLGPAMAFAAIGILAVTLRWLGGSDRTRAGSFDDGDYGLLRVAALTDDRAGAEVVRALLARAGIRATVAPALDGRVRVLVFASDLDRARRVVSGPAG